MLVEALAVNVIASVELFEVAPSETVDEVMAMVEHAVAPRSVKVHELVEIILALAAAAGEQPGVVEDLELQLARARGAWMGGGHGCIIRMRRSGVEAQGGSCYTERAS